MGGRLCLQLALDRPDAGRRARARERVARHRRRRRARRPPHESTSALAHEVERDGVDAFLERWLAQPLFASLPRDARRVSRIAAPRNTVDRLTHQLRCSGRARSRRTGTGCASSRCRCSWSSASRDTKYVDIAERMADAIPNARVEVIAGAGHACHLERPDDVRSPAHLLGSARARSASGVTVRTAARRRPGTSGSRVTSPASATSVASPHAYGSSGSAAASATPAAMPTDVSIIERHDRRERRPPRRRRARRARRRAAVASARSRRRRRARAVGGRRRAIGCTRRPRPARRPRAAPGRGRRATRPAARQLEVVAREACDHVDRGVDVPRAVGVDAQRDAPARPRRAPRRPARRRPRSRTFTFTAGNPRSVLGTEDRARRPARSPARRSRRAGGKPTQRGLLGGAPAAPRDRTGSPASGEHSPQPAGPSSSVTVRSPMRSRCSVRTGTAPRSRGPRRRPRASTSPRARRRATAGRRACSMMRTGVTASGQREQPEQRPGLRDADRDDRDERAHVAGDEQRRARRARRRAPRACACPRRVSVGMSRTLLASEDRAREQPDDERAPPRRARHLLDLHVRGADGRDEPEEHEHHDLAEAEVAVAAWGRRCRARRPRWRRRRRAAATGSTTSDSTRPDDRRDAERERGGALHRRAASRVPVAVSRSGPLRSRSVPRTPSE